MEGSAQADLKAGHLSEQKIKAELMRHYGVDKVENLPVNWRGVLIQRNEEGSNGVSDRHFGRIFDQIRRQDEVYQWGALISPLLALQTLSMALAGTDFEHHRDFVRAAEDHRRRIQWILNEDLSRHLERMGRIQGRPGALGADSGISLRIASFPRSGRPLSNRRVLAAGLVGRLRGLGSPRRSPARAFDNRFRMEKGRVRCGSSSGSMN